MGERIDQCLPAQRVPNGAIRTGPFVIAELHAAVKDMNNDKAAGLDGYGIEMEKYVAGKEYLEIELAMYNTILQSGDMPAILRDVIITVLYKGKGPRDDCDCYRGISLMSHKGKLLERLIWNVFDGTEHREGARGGQSISDRMLRATPTVEVFVEVTAPQ